MKARGLVAKYCFVNLIYKAACVCVSVSPLGHLVPGTNYNIDGLTEANSGTNFWK